MAVTPPPTATSSTDSDKAAHFQHASKNASTRRNRISMAPKATRVYEAEVIAAICDLLAARAQRGIETSDVARVFRGPLSSHNRDAFERVQSRARKLLDHYVRQGYVRREFGSGESRPRYFLLRPIPAASRAEPRHQVTRADVESHIRRTIPRTPLGLSSGEVASHFIARSAETLTEYDRITALARSVFETLHRDGIVLKMKTPKRTAYRLAKDSRRIGTRGAI